MRVFILTTGLSSDYIPVQEMFEDAQWDIVSHLDEAELICFTGGADVSPHLYGEENISSYCDPQRDAEEQMIYEYALRDRIPMVGICRGGQFLNVMNGGKMIQHVDGHSMGYHEIDYTDVAFETSGVLYCDESSTLVHGDHHQAMLPHEESNLIMKSWGGKFLNPGWSKNIPEVAEVILYPKTKCLCFQPHPEWGHERTKVLFFNLLKEYLNLG